MGETMAQIQRQHGSRQERSDQRVYIEGLVVFDGKDHATINKEEESRRCN